MSDQAYSLCGLIQGMQNEWNVMNNVHVEQATDCCRKADEQPYHTKNSSVAGFSKRRRLIKLISPNQTLGRIFYSLHRFEETISILKKNFEMTRFLYCHLHIEATTKPHITYT
jgi:hypothetical protein